MFNSWKHILLIPVAVLTLSIIAMSEPDLATIKGQIRTALLKSDYTGIYTMTGYRFGRRQEVMYQLWVKNGLVAREILSPLWQRGEVTLETETNYSYYLPAQSCALKIDKPANRNKIRLADWEGLISKITHIEASTTLLGREALVFTGQTSTEFFKIWVDRETYLPLAYDISRNNLLLKSIRFQQLQNLPVAFNSKSLIPEAVKWYYNENEFWQNTSVARIQAAVNFKILQPAYLPENYIFKKATLEELPGATVAQLLYEGPNNEKISIFEREKLSPKQKMTLNAKAFLQKNGQTIVTYQWFVAQVHLAIVGTVAQEELKKIAISVK